MMVIYLPVKFEFDWTLLFSSPETEILTDRQIDKKWTELHQFRKEPSYDGDPIENWNG